MTIKNQNSKNKILFTYINAINEKRAMELKEKWGFDFGHIPKDEVRVLLEEEIKYCHANPEYKGSSEYIRLLCGYLYCIGDKDIELIKEAKYTINFDVDCMIDAEWIGSLENGGIEDKEKSIRTRDEIINMFIDYSNACIWSRGELDFSD